MQSMKSKNKMPEFKKVTLDDKETISRYLETSEYRICDFSFINMYAWRNAYDTSFAVADDMLFVRVGNESDGYAFLPPVGGGDVIDSLYSLGENMKEAGMKLTLVSIPKELRAGIELEMPGKFEFSENRDGYDYLYEREKLASYSGKKLHSKKNHVNKFSATYNWRAEKINEDNLSDCVKVQNAWCAENDCGGKDKDINNETCAVRAVLTDFFKLPARGILIYVDDEPAAFSVGSKISKDTFDVHIEKALTKYDGIYSMICMQMALLCAEDCVYINREEDLGKEGLRKSKLSYRPVELLSKDVAVYKG